MGTNGRNGAWAGRVGAVLLSAALAAAGCTGEVDGEPRADAGSVLDGGSPVDAQLDPSDGAPPPIDAPSAPRLAADATLDGLALFQGVQVVLAQGGAPLATRNAPIVAGRRAVVRAYVSTAGPTRVTGELELREGARVVAVHRDTKTIDGASRDDDPGSVLQFDLPAEQITESASLSVRLVSPTGTLAPSGPHPARLPRDGSELALGAEDDGEGLELVLVPLRWDADGSGRLPDTSDGWLARLRALLTAMYPLVDVRITVRAAIPWNDSLTWTGNVDFGAINSMLLDLRVDDGASRRAYYFALVAPAETHSAYCGGSCVNGQSFVVSSADADGYRVGSAVGFGTDDSARTLAHELGHIHGRSHAPCGGASNADGSYPHPGGSIGVWGFDPRTSTFFDPAETRDFMGYCSPDWTSDYTWSAIFERTVAVSALSAPALSGPAPREVLLLRVGGERGAVIAGRTSLPLPSTGERIPYLYLDHAGAVLARGRGPALEQSHTAERLVVLPAPPLGATSVVIDGVELAVAPR